MPIFEYRCSECNSKFELLTTNKNSEHVTCPECKSSKTKKLFSTFSASVSASNSTNSCATGNCDINSAPSGGCASGMCGLN